jgi:hypothetical protein
VSQPIKAQITKQNDGPIQNGLAKRTEDNDFVFYTYELCGHSEPYEYQVLVAEAFC